MVRALCHVLEHPQLGSLPVRLLAGVRTAAGAVFVLALASDKVGFVPVRVRPDVPVDEPEQPPVTDGAARCVKRHGHPTFVGGCSARTCSLSVAVRTFFGSAVHGSPQNNGVIDHPLSSGPE